MALDLWDVLPIGLAKRWGCPLMEETTLRRFKRLHKRTDCPRWLLASYLISRGLDVVEKEVGISNG